MCTAFAFLATIKLNMQGGMEGNPMGKTKNFSRILALLTVPFTAYFYKVRRFLNLPEVVPQPRPMAGDFSFLGASKPTSPVVASSTVDQSSTSDRRDLFFCHNKSSD